MSAKQVTVKKVSVKKTRTFTKSNPSKTKQKRCPTCGKYR